MSGTESQDDSKLKDPMEEFLSAVGMAILKPTEKNNKVASDALKRVDCNPLSYAHIRTKITDDHNEHTFFDFALPYSSLLTLCPPPVALEPAPVGLPCFTLVTEISLARRRNPHLRQR